MTKFIKDNKILLIIIIISILCSSVILAERMGIEKQNKSYDIVLDYNEIAKLAEQSEHDISWWLSEFSKMGITKVGISEESIITLMEDTELSVSGYVMANLTKEAGWKDRYPEDFVEAISGYDSFDVLIEVEGAEAVDFVYKGITDRIREDRYIAKNYGDSAYFLIDGTSAVTLYSQDYKYMNSKKGGFAERRDVISSKIMYISLGLLPEKVKIAQEQGMDIIPRTLSYNGWNDTNYAKAVIAGYDSYGILPEYIIVGGEAVFGCDSGTEFAKNYICDNDITIGLIENTTQLQNIMQYGVDEVAITSGYDTVRVFSVWNYIQYRYQYYGYQGAEEIENTLFRAVTERNVRVIYFKPFLQKEDLHTYVTNSDEYAQMFTNLEHRLERHGFSFGSASVMQEYHVSKIMQILISIGAICAAVVLICAVLPIRKKTSYVLAGLGTLGVFGAFFIMPNTSVLLASFGSAVVFACLAVTYATANTRFLQEKHDADLALLNIILCAIVTLIITVIISLFGGMMTAAPISSTDFMLEISIFRGVKVSQLLPIAYFAIAYLAYYGFGSRKKHIGRLEFHDIKDMLCLDIKVWMILALAVVGALGYYYIARTGHDSSIGVSSIEMLFRNKLEEMLIARPRNKEFLFAFPAIMMMVYCAIKRLRLWTIVFGLGGIIGMTSVVNTFMHIRTPLYLGFIRTGYSLIFGLVLGIVAILIFDGLYRLYKRFLKEYVDKALAY